MNTFLNFSLIEYALLSITKRGSKNSFIFFILIFLIFLLSSVLMISDAIKYELQTTVSHLPEMTLQRLQAGKQVNIPVERIDELLSIEGVQTAIPRVWGYYYFKPAGINFSIVGIDAYEQQYKESLEKIVDEHNITALEKSQSMLIGSGVQKILRENYYQDFFNFITTDGKWQKVFIQGVFHSDLSLEANDIILLPKNLAHIIFGMPETEVTDIVLKIDNPKEISTIITKINDLYPDLRTITKDDIRISYQNIFDYKSGFFLMLFMVSAFTFFIIIYDKASGLSSEEKKEVGVLKAIGWSIDDILKERFYESFLLSFFAFIFGITLSIGYVFLFDAPLLRDVFIGYSQLKPSFHLPFCLNFSLFVILFFLSVPVYIAAVLIPSWKASTLDADEVMR